MIDKNLAQIPIIEDQAREAIRRIRLNNDALNEQLGVAEKFIQEEARAENKRLAYELSDYGIDKISQVDAESDQVSLGDSLRELLKKARNESSTTEEDLDSFLNSMKE